MKGANIQLSGKLTQVPEIARYHGEIYGNISLNSGISWVGKPPQTPRWVPKGPCGMGGTKKTIFEKLIF